MGSGEDRGTTTQRVRSRCGGFTDRATWRRRQTGEPAGSPGSPGQGATNTRARRRRDVFAAGGGFTDGGTTTRQRRRGGDDATTTRRRRRAAAPDALTVAASPQPLTVAAGPQAPSQSLQPPDPRPSRSLQPPKPAQPCRLLLVTPDPRGWVRIAVRIERGAQVPLTVAAQRCSRPGRALTVAAQSLQPARRPHSCCTVAAGPHSRCAALQPPRCPLQSLQVPRPSQSLRSVAALRGWGWGLGLGLGLGLGGGAGAGAWGLGPGALRIAGSGFRKAGEDRSEDRPLTVAAQRCSLQVPLSVGPVVVPVLFGQNVLPKCSA